MPVLTDILAERIETLVGKIEDSNRESARLNTNLEVLRGRVDSALSVAKWAIGLITVVVLAAAPAVFGLYRDVAILKQSIERIETKIDRLGQLDPKTEAKR